MYFNLLNIRVQNWGKYIHITFLALLLGAGKVRYLLYINRQHSVICVELLFFIKWNNLKHLAKKHAAKNKNKRR